MWIPRRLRHSYRHWTPRYIYNRLGVIWFEFRNPDEPWFTKTAIGILNSWLSKEDVGLEWGSGRSTIWFARRIKYLISVEHNEDWFRKVTEKIEESGLDNITYLHKSDVDLGINSGYVRVADEIAPCSLDFVLVDGHLRDFCALAALPLIKPGGIFIFDNANWFFPCQTHSPGSRPESEGPAPNFVKFFDQVRSWRCIWTSNGVWDTAFWIKPAL